MPTYDYRCEKCESVWDSFELVSNRDKPCKENCPECGEKKVVRHIGAFPNMATDTNLTANKKTGGQWNDLMQKVKSYTPDRYHDKLDKAGSQTGTRWKS